MRVFVVVRKKIFISIVLFCPFIHSDNNSTQMPGYYCPLNQWTKTNNNQVNKQTNNQAKKLGKNWSWLNNIKMKFWNENDQKALYNLNTTTSWIYRSFGWWIWNDQKTENSRMKKNNNIWFNQLINYGNVYHNNIHNNNNNVGYYNNNFI